VAFREYKVSLGQLLLIGLALLLGFNMVVAAVKWFVDTLDYQLSVVRDATGGRGGLLSTFTDFLEGLWSWLKYIFTNPMALAAVIAISLLALAMEIRWG